MSRPPAAPFGAGLFVTAFALRAAAAAWLAGEPVWDGHYYDFGARRIAAGFGYSDDVVRSGIATWHPWCHYPVGYSAYLAAFYRVLGPTHLAAHLANALAGALLAVVTYLLAREALDEKRARLAGGLVALHPGLVLYGALVMTEPLSALLVLASFLATLRVAKLRSLAWGAAAGGLVLGVAALVRPQALLCAPLLALAARGHVTSHHATETSRSKSPRADRLAALNPLPRVVAFAAIACACALVPVLPWTARNCRVMDGCALVSTNAGWNLAIGAFPRATGRFETLRSEDGCREVTGQVQQDRCWLHYGMSHVAASPGRWLGLVPKKLAFTFDHESFAVEYLHEARPSAWPEQRRALVRSLVTAFHRVLVVAAALAFVALALPRRERSARARVIQTALFAATLGAAYAGASADEPTFWPLIVVGCALPWIPLPGRPERPAALGMAIALVATTAIAHAVFFGEDRYHVVATPALCLLAAAALRRPARPSRESSRPDETRAARTPEGERAADPRSSE